MFFIFLLSLCLSIFFSLSRSHTLSPPPSFSTRRRQCWGPADQNWPAAMAALSRHDHSLHHFERLMYLDLHPIERQIDSNILLPPTHAVSFASSTEQATDGSNNSRPQQLYQCGAMSLRPAYFYGPLSTTEKTSNDNDLDDANSIMWREILAYLRFEELKEIGTLVSRDFNTIARRVWMHDAQPFKQWTNVLERMFNTSKNLVQQVEQQAKEAKERLASLRSRDHGLMPANLFGMMLGGRTGTHGLRQIADAEATFPSVTATSRWDESENEEPINAIDGNPKTWYACLTLYCVGCGV